jgi:hypothetical protein
MKSVFVSMQEKSLKNQKYHVVLKLRQGNQYLMTFQSGNKKNDCYCSATPFFNQRMIIPKHRIENIRRRLSYHYELEFVEEV